MGAVSAAELAGLIRGHLACEKKWQEVCFLDFDPFVWGQDFEIRDLSIKAVQKSKSRQVVQANFKNCGVAIIVRYDFRFLNGTWRLYDIVGSDVHFRNVSVLSYMRANKNGYDTRQTELDTQ